MLGERDKILWDFEIQMYHRILARRLDLRKKKCCLVNLAFPANHRVKEKKWDKYLDPARELKKSCRRWGVAVTPIVVSVLGTVLKGLEKGTGTIENQKNRDHPNFSIVEISQNAEKSLGDLLSLRLQWKPNR